jgi:hypothetical protein
MGKRRNEQASMDFELKAGDFVLLGGTRASYPSNWYLATVMWIGKTGVAIERSNQNGERWLQTCHRSEIRAIGTIADLCTIQRQASDAVRALVKEVHERESALGSARDAVFAKVDELAKGGLKVIPPNFEEIEADNQAVRDVIERHDNETGPTVRAMDEWSRS